MRGADHQRPPQPQRLDEHDRFGCRPLERRTLGQRPAWGTYHAPQTFDPSFPGLFYAHLNRDWTQEDYPNGQMTSISQSRAIYSNIEAYRTATSLGQDASRFASATQAGADYLLSSNMWDTTYDGWYWGVKLGPLVNSTSKSSYGQVHPVFALAHAYTITGDPAHLDGALAGLDAYTTHLSDPGYTGAYRGDAAQDWSNPGMRNHDYMFPHLRDPVHALAGNTRGSCTQGPGPGRCSKTPATTS